MFKIGRLHFSCNNSLDYFDKLTANNADFNWDSSLRADSPESALFAKTSILPLALKELTLSHIQQICSRRHWRHLVKTMETLYKSKSNYWIKLKTLRPKEKLLVLSNFFFRHNFFKSGLLQRCQKASICGKGLIWKYEPHLANISLVIPFNLTAYIYIYVMLQRTRIATIPVKSCNTYCSNVIDGQWMFLWYCAYRQRPAGVFTNCISNKTIAEMTHICIIHTPCNMHPRHLWSS